MTTQPEKSKMWEPIKSPDAACMEILDPGLSAHQQRLGEIRRIFGVTLHDTILDQLRDLAKILNPRSELTARELQVAVEDMLGGHSLDMHGRWIFYPWDHSLVHILPPDEFRQVRYNRNRYKITAAEQQRLS